MIRRALTLAAAAAFLANAGQAIAQKVDDSGPHPGAGLEVFASTDADKTEVIKIMARGLLDYEGPEKYRGVAFERAWFRPLGQDTREADRAYLDLADRLGDQRWKLRIGTDGHTVLGSASIRKDDWSHEFFVEREIVETPVGLKRRIYYTFAGASFDIPVDRRNVLTAMAGIQDFSGDNVRFHLRANYTHVLQSEWGLSVQVHGRYFHSTEPGEFDYYSPRNHVQLLPLIQVRRFDDNGWQYRLRAAYGMERDTNSGWHDSRYANLLISSPASANGWEMRVEAIYSSSSPTSGPDYYYLMGNLGIAKSF